MKTCKHLFILLSFIFFAKLIYGQKENIRFNHITINNGLSSSFVNAICKDSVGYMWFGGEGGLDRYDGYEIRPYKHDINKPGSFKGSIVTQIYKDKRNRIWISTNDAGINLYIRDKDCFKNYSFLSGNKTIRIKSRAFLQEDINGRLWISSDNGLGYLDEKKNSFVFFQNKNLDFSNDYLFSDSEGTFWVCGDNGQICYINPETLGVEKVTISDFISNFSNVNINRILEDKNHRFWLLTEKHGFFLFEKKEGKIIKHFCEANSGLNSDGIYDGLINDDGKIWLATSMGGLNIFDPVTESFSYLQHNPIDPYSLSTNALYTIYRDDHEIIWIGSVMVGINYYSQAQKQFYLFNKEGKDKYCLSNTVITSFCEDSNGLIYIGTDKGGLNRFNPKTFTFEHFLPDPNSSFSISGIACLCTKADSKENIWIGFWEKGLNRFDPKSKKFQRYNYDEKREEALGGKSIWSIFVDKNDNLWFAFHKNPNSTVDFFDQKTNSFQHYFYDKEKYLRATKVFKDSQQNVWVSVTPLGIAILDKEKKSFIFFRPDPSKSGALKNGIVNDIFEDSKNRLWFGTFEGLALFNFRDSTFKTLTGKDGLPCDKIYSIQEDNKGNLWLGTDIGLVMFNPDTKKSKKYDVSDGIQSKVFYIASCLKTSDGWMLFGGPSGFNYFHPDSIKDNKIIPPVVFTKFSLFNQIISNNDSAFILKKPIDLVQEIILDYNQSVISFEFAALNYTSTEKNQYAYKMDGFETNWNYVGKKRTATYTNLNPGEYIFRVKACNNDGYWNEKGASVKIIILPPWWETLWFKLLIIIFILILLIYIILKIINRIKLLANQTILNEQNQLKTLINNIPDRVFIKDNKSRFIVVNESQIKFLNCKNEKEILYKTDFDFCPHKIAGKFYKQEQKIITSGISLINEEEEINKNGKLSYISTTKCPIINIKGETIGLIAIIKDITAQKMAELEIIKKSKELEKNNLVLNEKNALLEERQQQIEEQSEEIKIASESLKETNKLLLEKQQLVLKQSSEIIETNKELSLLNATKDKFFSIIAHDLKNPFSSVLGFCDLLTRKYDRIDDNRRKNIISVTYDSAKKLYNLLENLLQWARSQTESIKHEPQEFILNEIIETNISLAENLISEKNLEIKLDIKNHLKVFADKNMIDTVIRNLLTNAIKYTENGVISIATVQSEKNTEVSISDTGVGISNDKLDSIFGIMSSKSTKGTNGEEGSGLGLIICKDFIEKNGGTIKVSSKEGEGSTFYFTIPNQSHN